MGGMHGRGQIIDQAGNLSPVGVVEAVSLDLSAAELVALDSSPVVVVEAPGPGKAIVFVAAAIAYTYGTEVYDNANALRLQLVAGNPLAATEGGFLPLADPGDVSMTLVPQPGGFLAADVPLVLAADVDAGGDGDGTARLTVLYYIMDLSD